MAPQTPRTATYDLTHLQVHALTWGPDDGRLVLALHGFPDSAWGWTRTAELLAGNGHRVVAPFMRGYAPTGPAPDGCYHVAALMRDALDLHEALGAPEDAVVVGHDWGAIAVNGLIACPDSPFAAHVTMSVPNLRVLADRRGATLRRPGAMLRQAFRSWYIAFFQAPVLPESILPWAIPKLWKDWGPSGSEPTREGDAALAALPTRAHRRAALGYYRALVRGGRPPEQYRSLHPYVTGEPVHPVVHLQGALDGAIEDTFTDLLEEGLPAGSRVVRFPEAGHFLQVEQPAEVAEAILLAMAGSARR